MARKLIVLLSLVTVALPVLGRAHDYDDEDDSVWNEQPDAYPEMPDAPVTFDTFRDDLAPYGDWVDVPTYGQVWRPANVDAGWRPYLYGRWEWTAGGWLWVSDEPWGWAAYHYGRWASDPRYGWIWVPAYQWAPAWVTWRFSADYVGWAPLAPGVSVQAAVYPVDYRSWSFVPCDRFVGVPVRSVVFSGGHAQGIFRSTVAAPPRAMALGVAAPAWGGPSRPFVERTIGRPIAPVRVQPVASPSALRGPARPGVVSVYRPEVRSAPPGGRPAMTTPARPWSGAPARAEVLPAPSPGARAPGQGLRPASPVSGNGGWRNALPTQAPAPAWRNDGQGSRPQQFAPPLRQGPSAISPRTIPVSAPAPAARYAPAPRQQVQAGGGFPSVARAQPVGALRGNAQAARGSGYAVLAIRGGGRR